MTDWKEIPEFEDLYQVSSEGGIFSIKSRRALRPSTNRDGYKQIQLCKEGKIYTRLVHNLMLRTFIGPPQLGQVGLHIDDVKDNNILSNLEWGSNQKNMGQAITAGRIVRGEGHHNSRLTEAQVLEIREKYLSSKWTDKHQRKTCSHSSLAHEYGVSEATIRNIVEFNTWIHVARK